jgi:hypothetical protein
VSGKGFEPLGESTESLRGEITDYHSGKRETGMRGKVARSKIIREAPAGYNESSIVIYETSDGVRLDVKLERDTLWLTQKQMAELFETERSVITKHLRNIFQSGELIQDSVCANFALTAADGKTYQTVFYHLDAVISVGYRVNSKRGTQFRIWATSILRDHLLKGYSINERRLWELNRTIRLIADVAGRRELLYFLIKDHPFVDGNKRIGAALFLWFLEKNGILYHADGTKRIADTALVAMTLLIAESKSAEKDLLTRVLINLIGQREP